MKIKFIIMKLQNTTWKLIDQLLSKILGAGKNFFLHLVDFHRSKTFDNVYIGCEIHVSSEQGQNLGLGRQKRRNSNRKPTWTFSGDFSQDDNECSEIDGLEAMKDYKFDLHQDLEHSFLQPCGYLIKMIWRIF